MRPLSVLGAVTAMCLITAQPGAARMAETVNEYHLAFTGKDDRHVQVEAEVEISGNSLLVDPDEIWYLPGTESWWERIRVQQVEDLPGNALELGERQGHRRPIEGPPVGRIRIRYVVDLSYVDEQLPYGNSAAGAASAKGFFTVAKPLFVRGDDFPGARIRIEKPEGLRFDAPWVTHGEGFLANSFEELTLAAVSLGDYGVYRTQKGGLDYTLIALALDDEVRTALARTMSTVARLYLEHYPMPSRRRYFQFVYPGQYPGGEAYPTSSVASIVPERLGEGEWKFMLAHELFHVWNPFLIPGAKEEELEWFKEGFTTYLSELSLVESGEIDSATWDHRAEAHYARYIEGLEAAPDSVTIMTSGAAKDEYGSLVYDGGWAIACWLDRALMDTSDGAIDLRTLMGKLIRSVSEREPLDTQSLLAAIGATDPALAESLEGYLASRAPVPKCP